MLTKEMIRKMRDSRGFTGKYVAECIGIAYPVYQSYESGVRNAGLPVVEKLADFYGVSTDFLLGRAADADSKSAELEKLDRIAGTLPPEDVAVLLVVAERFKAKSAPKGMQEAQTLETISEAVDDAEAKKDA